MSNDELMKKITSLKDLKEAIKLIKQASSAAPIQKADIQVASDTSAPTKELAQSEDVDNELKHTDFKTDGDGSIVHYIEHPKSNKKYELRVDMSQEKPIITIRHIRKDRPASQSSKIYENIQSAIKSIIDHHHSGNWE